MKYQPDYSINLKDGTSIPLLFNTSSFRSYSALKGIEYEDLLESVRNGSVFKANNIPDLIYTAALSAARANQLPFNYSITDAELWVDDMGGLNNADLAGIYKIFVGKLLNLSPEVFEAIWTKAVNGEQEPPKQDSKKKAKVKSTPGNSSI